MLRSGTVPLQRHVPTNLEASHLADDDRLSALASALEHPDPELRARAVVVMAEFADNRAGRLLKVMIHDRCPAVRAVAVGAAGRTTDTDLVPSLIVALGDPDADVRRAAAEAVSRLTGQTVAPSVTDASIDREELERLKRWWKDKRFTDLARHGEH
jgi:HEAT repeat protein